MATIQTWKSNKPKLVLTKEGVYSCYDWQYFGLGRTPEEAYEWWKKFVDNFQNRVPYSDFHETMHHLLKHQMLAEVLPNADLREYFPY